MVVDLWPIIGAKTFDVLESCSDATPELLGFSLTTQSRTMRWSVLSLLLPLLTLVAAYSSAGNRLLVVLEDAAKKDSYSKFWADLTGTHH